MVHAKPPRQRLRDGIDLRAHRPLQVGALLRVVVEPALEARHRPLLNEVLEGHVDRPSCSSVEEVLRA